MIFRQNYLCLVWCAKYSSYDLTVPQCEEDVYNICEQTPDTCLNVSLSLHQIQGNVDFLTLKPNNVDTQNWQSFGLKRIWWWDINIVLESVKTQYVCSMSQVQRLFTFEAIPNIAITVVGYEEILQLLVICSILVVLQIQIQFVNYICICKYYLWSALLTSQYQLASCHPPSLKPLPDIFETFWIFPSAILNKRSVQNSIQIALQGSNMIQDFLGCEQIMWETAHFVTNDVQLIFFIRSKVKNQYKRKRL